jgi:hypothetical protein
MPEESPVATRYVFIPYMRPTEPLDDGSRPLKILAGVTYYTCSSIHVNGVSYDGAPLAPGPVELSLLVANSGALGAWVTARFYLSDPVTGFSPDSLLGSTVPFYVPAETKAEQPERSPRKFYDVPEGKSHLCLFAEAWCAADPSTKPGNAIDDRHWGQQNLTINVVQSGQRLKIPFTAVGQAEAGLYEIGIRRLGAKEGVQSFDLSREAVQLTDLEQGIQSTVPIRIELHPWEHRSFMVVIDIPLDAASGTSAELVIEQSAVHDQRLAPTGAIGVTIKVA